MDKYEILEELNSGKQTFKILLIINAIIYSKFDRQKVIKYFVTKSITLFHYNQSQKMCTICIYSESRLIWKGIQNTQKIRWKNLSLEGNKL